MSQSRGMRNTILKNSSCHTLLNFSSKMKTINQSNKLEFVQNIKYSKYESTIYEILYIIVFRDIYSKAHSHHTIHLTPIFEICIIALEKAEKVTITSGMIKTLKH